MVLSIIDPASFLGGNLSLDADLAREAIRQHVAEPLGLKVEEAAAGIKRIVDTRMADLLRTVTIERGHDPREFSLYAFGGAGATHVPSFALDIVDEIVVPSSQSVFCAFGAVASDVKLILGRAVPVRVNRQGEGQISDADIEDIFAELETQAAEALDAQDVERE